MRLPRSARKRGYTCSDMEYIWVFLILLYGIIKGIREVLKKKAMETNSIMEVLFFYTLFAFIMIIPLSQNVFEVGYKYHIALLCKAGIIFLSWLCALNSIKRLPLSVYSVMDMGRIIFSTLLGVIFLGERLGPWQIVGMTLVIGGITLVNLKSKQGSDERASRKVVLLVLASGILNALSSLSDKWLLSTDPNRFIFGAETITSSQLQFWYMLYLTFLYGLYIVIKKEKIDVKKAVKCPWIWILSLLFVIADRALFIANSNPNSTMVTMTLIKQSSVLVTIAMGRLVYKEKHIFYRVCCAILIILGIMISLKN